ncbi:hypothetical protein Dsin_032106 [Dipteronia sinensis]|uniref:Uncharacterized protein n=1 Tax=Dipteronia sinensis TaxID=43782 RepID=A0AAE0DU05_9ROSI|nr:hypothetical protein Dsin_032106 [Dipteronia sinensis]
MATFLNVLAALSAKGIANAQPKTAKSNSNRLDSRWKVSRNGKWQSPLAVHVLSWKLNWPATDFRW